MEDLQIISGSYSVNRITGTVYCLDDILNVFTPFNTNIFIDTFFNIYSSDASFNEISNLWEDHCEFSISFESAPDRYGKKYDISGTAHFSSESYDYGGGSGAVANGVVFSRVEMRINVIELIDSNWTQTGTINLIAEKNNVESRPGAPTGLGIK